VVIGDGAVVQYSIIAENVVVKKQAKIGADRQQINKITVLGSEVTIDEHCQVTAGQMIEKDVRK
jgi:NDP-sugar pyrophosphorylase family protein